MKIEVIENDTVLYTGENLPEGPLDIVCDIQWPTVLTIKLSNKNPDDAEIVNDVITKDKAIILETMSINNFPLETRVIEQLVNDIIYWGFNGTVTMAFTELNTTRWLLKMKNIFDMKRLQWN
jgi:hypothetical protein